jgi:hypothetical protein
MEALALMASEHRQLVTVRRDLKETTVRKIVNSVNPILVSMEALVLRD